MDTRPPRLPLCAPLAPGRAAQADNPALVHGTLTLSHARVAADVERVAARLLELGIAPGDIVAVHLRKPVSHWMTTLGLMRIGAVSVSLTSNGANELAALPGVSTVLCSPGEEDAFPETLWRVAVTSDWLDRPAPAAGTLPSLDTADRTVGRICFTSGTSGRPKAILLDAALLGARLAGTARRAGISSASTLWCGLGADTAYGFTATLAAWREGGTVVLSAGGEGAFTRMHAHGVNILIASPAALAPLIRDAQATALARIDGPALVAGGRLSADLRDQIQAHVCTRVRIAYGSSEAGGVTFGDAGALDIHPGRVGAVFRDIEVEVIGPDGGPLPPGTEGRLRVRTESTVPGYLNDDAASAEVFDGGWFYPGDIAMLSPGGDLTLLGRAAQVLNLGGVKVPVEALEERLRALDGVADACAFLYRQGAAEPELVLVVVAADKLATDKVATGAAATGLGAAIRAAVPPLPRFALFSARELPRGSMGKLRKQAVAEAVGAALEGAEADFGLVPRGSG